MELFNNDDHHDTENNVYSANDAVTNNDVSALKKIAEIDKDLLFEPDENDWQPIHVAARDGFINVIEYLLQEGADINALCTYGTPLDVAIDHNDDRHPVIQKLRDLGGLSEMELGDNDDVEDYYYMVDNADDFVNDEL
jgi:ankyrin repeat protein